MESTTGADAGGALVATGSFERALRFLRAAAFAALLPPRPRPRPRRVDLLDREFLDELQFGDGGGGVLDGQLGRRSIDQADGDEFVLGGEFGLRGGDDSRLVGGLLLVRRGPDRACGRRLGDQRRRVLPGRRMARLGRRRVAHDFGRGHGRSRLRRGGWSLGRAHLARARRSGRLQRGHRVVARLGRCRVGRAAAAAAAAASPRQSSLPLVPGCWWSVRESPPWSRPSARPVSSGSREWLRRRSSQPRTSRPRTSRGRLRGRGLRGGRRGRRRRWSARPPTRPTPWTSQRPRASGVLQASWVRWRPWPAAFCAEPDAVDGGGIRPARRSFSGEVWAGSVSVCCRGRRCGARGRLASGRFTGGGLAGGRLAGGRLGLAGVHRTFDDAATAFASGAASGVV